MWASLVTNKRKYLSICRVSGVYGKAGFIGNRCWEYNMDQYRQRGTNKMGGNFAIAATK